MIELDWMTHHNPLWRHAVEDLGRHQVSIVDSRQDPNALHRNIEVAVWDLERGDDWDNMDDAEMHHVHNEEDLQELLESLC